MTGPAWPDGHRFAFTIFDDTDLTTLDNGPPVYDLLTDLGLRVTKSVWMLAPRRAGTTGGGTCADPAYQQWVLRLQQQGHEIAFHNATDASSKRPDTLLALDRFREVFGHDPRCGANHTQNREAIYWGPARLHGARARLYNRLTHGQREAATDGEQPDSEWFWGDLCQQRITYWRNFTFTGINTLAAVPPMPYHDPSRPYVNRWFAATEASNAYKATTLLSEANLDALEADGGLCILYTHLGSAWWEDGRLHAGARDALERLMRRNPWAVPVSDVLDHLAAERGVPSLAEAELARIERRWLRNRIRVGLR